MRAISALLEYHPPQAGQWIRPLLSDREAPVRNAAIVALGALRDQDSFGALVACLAAPMSLERGNAVEALAALNNPEMREPLAQALQVEPVPQVRCVMVRALSSFHGAEDVKNLLIASLTDSDEDVRATAAVALSRLGVIEALPALQRMALVDDNQETSIGGLWVSNSTIAQQAIEKIRTPETTPELAWPDS